MPVSDILLTIQTDTKEEEKEIILQFLLRLQYPIPLLNSSERPDFEIQFGKNIIGIEVTKYYSDFTRNGSSTQKKISEWKKFSENLKQQLIKVNSDYEFLYGAIHFHSRKNTYKQLGLAFFNELVKLIESNRLKEGEETTVSIIREKYPILSRNIESIFLLNTFPEHKYLWWDASLQSGEVIKNEGTIQFILEKKEITSKHYKTNYLQKWLIIYAGGIGLHDIYSNAPGKLYRQGKVAVAEFLDHFKAEEAIYKSQYFTHIFIWDKFTETIYLLYPYFKKIFDYGKREIYVNHLPLKDIISSTSPSSL